jgi:hypothetical protein
MDNTPLELVRLGNDAETEPHFKVYKRATGLTTQKALEDLAR